MKEVIEQRRNYSPQEVQDQEPYYWVVSLWAGEPNGFGVGVKHADGRPCRELITKKHERAFDLAERWLGERTGQGYATIEQVAVTSVAVYVK